MPELENLFADAIALEDPAQQQDFLDSACKDNPALRNRVGKLIDANRRAQSFMSEPAAIIEVADEPLATGLGIQRSADQAVGEQPGDRVGRYELIEQIGEGGMGWVFEAEQLEPIRRKVALKVVKPGLDTKEVIARFESERQALALMDHPNIAKVLDAGATDSGRPFFAMELVDGSALTDFCNQQQLTTRQRLELFIPICGAIQHAHHKGVLHRDIKPRNILVSSRNGEFAPKVIDFGIAKAFDTASWEHSQYRTRFGQFVGTPAYMSPEQAESDSQAIDTRSDVYSLGATLYEVLTGQPPFDETKLKTKSQDEIRRLIADETPIHPSQAVSTIQDGSVAENQKTTTAKLAATMQGELDWIVLRALEKDPERRYCTAAALADDIRRFLDNEIVAARPATKRYRLQKFLQRNRSSVAIAAAFAGLLILATCLSTGLAIWGNDKAKLASAKVESLQEVHEFLRDGLFAQAGPLEEPNRNIRLSTVVKRAEQKLENSGPLRPDVEAPIRATIGQMYRGLGEYQHSLKHLRRAHTLFESEGAGNLALARASNELAEAHLLLEDFAAAKPLLENSINIAKAHGDVELGLESTKLMAWYFESAGEPEQAEVLLQEILVSREQSLGPDHVETFKAKANLGYLYLSTERIEEAEKLLSVAHAGMTGTQLWYPATLKMAVRLAEANLRLGNVQQAEKLYSDAVHDTSQQLGAKSSQTLTAKQGLAQIRFLQREYDQTATLLEEVLDIQTEQFGDTHRLPLATTHNLAMVHAVLGNGDEAESLYLRELAGRRARLESSKNTDNGSTTAQLTAALSQVAFFYADQREFAKAVPMYAELVERLSDSVGEIHEETLIAQTLWAQCHYKSGDHQAAKPLLAKTLDQAERSYPTGWLRPVVEGMLGEVLGQDESASDDAEFHLLQSYELLKQRNDELPLRWKPLGLRAATRRLADFYQLQGDMPKADEYREEYARVCEAVSKELKESFGDGDTN